MSFFWLIFTCYVIFHPFTFNFPGFLYFATCTCVQHRAGFCFDLVFCLFICFIHSDIFSLLIRIFIYLHTISDIYKIKLTILLFVLNVFFLLYVSFFPFFLCLPLDYEFFLFLLSHFSLFTWLFLIIQYCIMYLVVTIEISAFISDY